MNYLDPEFSTLPDGWTSKKLQDVVEIHNTKRQPLNGRERESHKGIYPYCGANRVVDYIDDYRFDGEYVLIAEDGGYWGKHQSSSYIMRGKFWVNNHAHVVCAKDAVTTNVFFSNIVNYLNIDPFIGGDARGKLTKAILTQLAIPLPPLPEQKKIAHILSTVQRAIEAQERIIQTTTELKKALMHKLFTEGLRNEPQKQTEIGPVPESWEVCKVGDVAKIQSGGTPTREIAENWIGGTIPWLKTGEINYCVIHETEEKITPTGLANSAARLFPKGTLLMAMYGQGITRGRVGLLGIEAATNQACASITPTDKKGISSVFLYYFFEYHYEDHRKLGHGANQRNMNAALIRSFPLAFPKPDEQTAVVTALESLDQKRGLNERKKTELQDLFRTLLHELMTAKTRIHNAAIQV